MTSPGANMPRVCILHGGKLSNIESGPVGSDEAAWLVFEGCSCYHVIKQGDHELLVRQILQPTPATGELTDGLPQALTREETKFVADSLLELLSGGSFRKRDPHDKDKDVCDWCGVRYQYTEDCLRRHEHGGPELCPVAVVEWLIERAARADPDIYKRETWPYKAKAHADVVRRSLA